MQQPDSRKPWTDPFGEKITSTVKLIHDFFQITETTRHTGGATIAISLNPDHLVYTGHFPGHPVTPGVVQLQIIHELLEKELGTKLRLCTIPQGKFLKILNPLETPQIDICLHFNPETELLQVKASGEKDGQTFFKIQATYQMII